MNICVVIPAYNEAENIERVIADVKTNAPGCDYVIINDCSKDNTREIVEKNGYNCIHLPINLGLSGAVQTGYRYAYEHDYDAVIQFDGDGQHQARFIPLLADEIEKGMDIAIGSRFVNQKKDMSARMMGSRIISTLIKMTTGQTITDPTSGMRMLGKEMMKDYALNMNRSPEPDTLVYMMKRGAKVKEVQVEMSERIAGQSIYSSTWNSVKYMVRTCISIIFMA